MITADIVIGRVGFLSGISAKGIFNSLIQIQKFKCHNLTMEEIQGILDRSLETGKIISYKENNTIFYLISINNS